MTEGNHLESEIADLSRQIEAKRLQLEQETGVMVEDREAVAEVIKDQLTSTDVETTVPVTVPVAKTTDDGDDYLDSLDESTAQVVNNLIAKLPEIGLAKTIALARETNPFYLDVLHDALTSRLYDELVAQGYLKKA
ncbi:MAG: hypothetical protein A2556_01420 [Candidatus Vogelbacteria bacterium RIFOXYD2_FULL_44_9]|uniref:Uncharacterized protein n=1 Tax=Candidatus Vogelbacteria bacterium RIFOXYD2_FULL_44_9 TaxID=1802441 RepID=A0A1G2QN61_9BACT|nr:MAG: hypothetical protein A2556_01420 [Candidatus Vogelbacteria bacterium RIFOXYD2_FULL_44_9]